MQGNAPLEAYTTDKLTEKIKVEGQKTILWQTNSDNEGSLPETFAGGFNKIGTSFGGKINGEPIEKRYYLGTDLSAVTAATINELRQAVAVQQYYEALSRGGSRYREQVQALWDVTISDKTVQIPEYLGGGRYQVNVNQIIQTSGQQNENDTIS